MDVTTVVMFCQYVPSCLAVLVLRARHPDAPRSFRVPGGPTVPALASAFSIGLVVWAWPASAEWLFVGQLLLGGFAVWGLTAWARRRVAAPAAHGPG